MVALSVYVVVRVMNRVVGRRAAYASLLTASCLSPSYLAAHVRLRVRAMSARRPPGPKEHPLTGSLGAFRRDMLGFLTQCAREYGDVVSYRVAHVPCCLVNHPTLIEQVLVAESDRVIKNWNVRRLKVALGDGLLTNEPPAWKRQRRLIQPAFHNDRIREYAAIMVQRTDDTVAGWRDGEVRDLHADLMALTLRIVAETLFGVDLAPEARAVANALGDFIQWIEGFLTRDIPLPIWVPTRANRRAVGAARQLDAVIASIVRRRRASHTDDRDLLGALLAAKDDDGIGMTDGQLRDEIATLLLAGHETTAIALCWTLMLVARHPEVEMNLVAEARSVLGNRSPGAADIGQLPYARMVVQESLRLYPPAWAFGREARATIRLGDYEVRRGTQIFIVPWVIHRDARFFQDPEHFRPERWKPEAARGIPKYAYCPFGGGPRYCVGSSFAMMEAVLLLTTLLRRCRLRLLPEHPIELQPAVTLRPRYGIRATVLRRD